MELFRTANCTCWSAIFRMGYERPCGNIRVPVPSIGGMKTKNDSHLPRMVVLGALPLLGVVLSVSTLAGCARRPIIVQTPAPTVVQNPAPPTVVQTPAPASTTLAPTGRDVIVVKEAPPPPREE